MKYKLLVLVLLLNVCNVSIAQHISLEWEGTTNYFGDSIQARIFPKVTNGIYDVVDDVPRISFHFKKESLQDVEITNVEWKQITENELYSISKQNIPTQDQIYGNSSFARDEAYTTLYCTPFKKVGQSYFQLQSFDYKLTSSRKPTIARNKATPINSVLSDENKTFYKIKIDSSGIYKIDKTFLLSKLPSSVVNNINPKKIKIYGNGGKMLREETNRFRYEDLQENAIQVFGEDDETFNDSDYVLFYAQGPNDWEYPETLSEVPFHHVNIYEDFSYYYICFDGENGKRVAEENSGIPSTFATTYDDHYFFDEEKTNVNATGRIWVGNSFTTEDTQTFTFKINNIDTTSPVYWETNVMTRNAINNKISLTLNSVQALLPTSVFSNAEFYEQINSGNTLLTTSGNSIVAKITVDNSLNPSGKVFFNYLELNFKSNLSFNGSQMNFRSKNDLNDGSLYGFRMISNGVEQVWDVSDITNAKRKTDLISGGDFELSYQSTHPNFRNEFVAFKSANAFAPTWIGKVAPQDLHGLRNIDYIIVTHKDFISEATKIKQYHATTHNYNVAIVTAEQVYNEFSSGSQDISAIRDFAKYLYEIDNKKLKYLLLLGDTSYDYKNRIDNNENIIPAHLSYESNDLARTNGWITDDFFALLDDTDYVFANSNYSFDASKMDIAVGRIPAANIEEAQILVGKVLRYNVAASEQINPKYDPFGDWRLKVHIVTDNNNSNNGVIADSSVPFHQTLENTVSSWIESTYPEYTVRKLYMDAFQPESTAAGLRYPALNQAITNAIETGTLLVNYFGHGGPRGWSAKRILTNEEMVNYGNNNVETARLPFIVTITCEFTVWDNPNLVSGGEFFIKKEDGGGVGLITTSRAIGVGYGEVFNKEVIHKIFALSGSQYLALGEALRQAKVLYGNNSDHLNVALLCDPALSLARPPRDIKLLTINGQPADTYNGTFRAFDFVTVEGEVLNANATARDTQFNGNLDATLLDKVVMKSTINYEGHLGVMNYPEQINSIYKGSSTVTNGFFKLQFYVPKDINYTIGNGKLVLYAENYKTDAKSYKIVKVGDINPAGIQDDEGPKVRLFMNNTHFANGGITDRNPLFIACVTDSTGINATGLGIGHDITGVLDGNIDGTIVMNEFYSGGNQNPCINNDLQDFQKGKVAYQFRSLDYGNHTIKFKVWDINNNSTTAYLDFIVMQNGDQGLVIDKPLNWPNPFTDKTYFHFEHNCDDILEVQVQILTVSGKIIKTIRQSVSSEPFREGYRTDKFGIPWDGTDDFGDKVGKGVYIYKLLVKGQNGESCSGSASAIEKLVILK